MHNYCTISAPRLMCSTFPVICFEVAFCAISTPCQLRQIVGKRRKMSEILYHIRSTSVFIVTRQKPHFAGAFKVFPRLCFQHTHRVIFTPPCARCCRSTGSASCEGLQHVAGGAEAQHTRVGNILPTLPGSAVAVATSERVLYCVE